MIFTFVWAGWEGIAHDLRVLTEVVHNPATYKYLLLYSDYSFILFSLFIIGNSIFPISITYKYYLCDAAYANNRGFLAPYRNTRYWLADF